MEGVKSISIGKEFTYDKIKNLKVKEFPKIAILIPTYNNLPALFFISLLRFIQETKNMINTEILITEGTYVWHSRNTLADEALKTDAEYFICLAIS